MNLIVDEVCVSEVRNGGGFVDSIGSAHLFYMVVILYRGDFANVLGYKGYHTASTLVTMLILDEYI